jgi:glycosyltransferase involved in cell wall biosynthesis
MACGLPVISSNLPFNNDILDDTCSVRVNPVNIDEIAAAIELLRKDEPLRVKLANGALEKSRKLDIESRAQNIIRFIESKL